MNRQPASFIIGLLLIIVILVGGYYAISHMGVGYQTVVVQTAPTPADPGSGTYRATLTGTYLCLPHSNTSGPQTMECALGMQTGDGRYYALDFNSASQGVGTLASGDRFTAAGVVTPAERLNTDQWRRYPITGIFSVQGDIQKISATTPTNTTVTSATIQIAIGQTASGAGVTITPIEVADDSRCPKGVSCIWAGTVHVRARIQNEAGTSEATFELGKSITLGGENVALTAVAPDKTQSEISASSYRFTFDVSKK